MKLIILFSRTAIPLTNIYLWKQIINAILDYSRLQYILYSYLLIYIALQVITYLIGNFDEYVNSRYSDELQFYIEEAMIEKTARMDMSFFDSALMADKVNNAQNNFGVVTQMSWLVFDILSTVINVVSTLIIVSLYKWWLGFVTLILLIPFLVYNKKRVDKKMRLEKEQLRDCRKRDYYKGVFFNNDIQFEIKLNGIGKYFIRKYHEKWDELYRQNKKEDLKHTFFSALIMIINVMSEGFVLSVSAFDVAKCIITVGDLQYNLSMVTRLRNQSQSLMQKITRFLNSNSRIIDLKEFIDIRPEVEKSGTKIPSPNPKVEFCSVSFHYPNSEKYILKDCSFVINPCEKVGLIGLNGSGKSTIIKLMFRFYDPQEGVIKLDGIDLKEYDVYAVRKLFAVLFQDYVSYCLPLREIIALSDFDERFNDKKLDLACDKSGVDKIITDWSDRYDSILGRQYADSGKDLSGGQWQLVSLARAYFKYSEFVVLDEPSAALDPISEDKIFEQLYRLSENKTSVTISHRLSNTVLADRILVIKDGSVIEQGSHFELLEQDGEYAHLFKLQASKYV